MDLTIFAPFWSLQSDIEISAIWLVDFRAHSFPPSSGVILQTNFHTALLLPETVDIFDLDFINPAVFSKFAYPKELKFWAYYSNSECIINSTNRQCITDGVPW